MIVILNIQTRLSDYTVGYFQWNCLKRITQKVPPDVQSALVLLMDW